MELNWKNKKVALDTNIFIYFFENNQKYANTIENFLKTWEKERTILSVADILFTELLVGPFKVKDYSTASKWLQFFNTARIEIKSTTSSITIKAAKLRAMYNLKTPDSIHLATAMESDCDYFIGNDSKLKKIKEIKTLCLSELQ